MKEILCLCFFFQAEDGIRDRDVTGVQTCALPILLVDEEAAKMINEEELKLRAVENAEQNGIVFIDEIDKIARRQETMGADVSREGVQRDLLPLVEGCTVNTKYGTVKTDHVLFIASGAFPMTKPSSLIPEMQG